MKNSHNNGMDKIAEHIAKNILNARNAAGLSQKELADKCKYSQTYISKIELGRASPSIKALDILAHALNISTNELTNKGSLNKQPIESNVATITPAIMIPVVSDDVSACCGKGSIYADDVKWEIVGYVPVEDTQLIGYTWQTNNFNVIKAEGSSMEPRIRSGDRILFADARDLNVVNGDFALLLWDGRLLIRAILFEDEKITLHPTNPEYEDIVIKHGDERLCVLGKVIAKVPKIEKLTGLW